MARKDWIAMVGGVIGCVTGVLALILSFSNHRRLARAERREDGRRSLGTADTMHD